MIKYKHSSKLLGKTFERRNKMLFKVRYALTCEEYTVYAVKPDNFTGARFLIYDQEKGWSWIDSAYCVPV